MMDYIQMISSVGFPIVAFLMIYYHHNVTTKTLSGAVKENTVAIRELSIYIRGKR